MPAQRPNPMDLLTPEQRRLHTIPGRRALQFSYAERQIRRIVDDRCLLTEEQRFHLAAILLANGTAK